MIPPSGFLERLSKALEGEGIPWMITGSTASAFYGEPRAFIISPEGSILSKLEWSRLGGSERQLRDAASVLAACRASLDWTYLRLQADSLGIADLLRQIEADGSHGPDPRTTE